MAQALCWLAARLAGLAGVAATDQSDVLLLTGKPVPVPGWTRRRTAPAGLGSGPLPGWLLRPMRWAGYLRAGEEPHTEAALSFAARQRLAVTGRPRAEFVSGVFAGFRSRVLREAADFAALKARGTA